MNIVFFLYSFQHKKVKKILIIFKLINIMNTKKCKAYIKIVKSFSLKY